MPQQCVVVVAATLAGGGHADTPPNCVVGDIDATTLPSISGNASVGSTLTANPGTYSHCNSYEQPTRLYAWYSESGGQNRIVQDPTTSRTYTVGGGDSDSNLTVQEHVCNDDNCEWFVSAPVHVAGRPVQCSDGVDNDGDGYVDAEDRHGGCYLYDGSDFLYQDRNDDEGQDWWGPRNGTDDVIVDVVDEPPSQDNVGRCRTLTAKRRKRIFMIIGFTHLTLWEVSLKLRWCHDNRKITMISDADPFKDWAADWLIFPERIRVDEDCDAPGACSGRPPLQPNSWTELYKVTWQVEDCFPPYKWNTVCEFFHPWIKFQIYGDGNYGCTTDTGASPCKADPPTAVLGANTPFRTGPRPLQQVTSTG